MSNKKQFLEVFHRKTKIVLYGIAGYLTILSGKTILPKIILYLIKVFNIELNLENIEIMTNVVLVIVMPLIFFIVWFALRLLGRLIFSVFYKESFNGY